MSKIVQVCVCAFAIILAAAMMAQEIKDLKEMNQDLTSQTIGMARTISELKEEIAMRNKLTDVEMNWNMEMRINRCESPLTLREQLVLAKATIFQIRSIDSGKFDNRNKIFAFENRLEFFTEGLLNDINEQKTGEITQ